MGHLSQVCPLCGSLPLLRKEVGSGWILCCIPTASFTEVLFSPGRALRFGICRGKGPFDMNEATSPCTQWLSPPVFCNTLRIHLNEGSGTDANCKTKNRADAKEVSERPPRTHLGPPASGLIRDHPHMDPATEVKRRKRNKWSITEL